MKNLIPFAFLLLVIFTACDIVDVPIPEPNVAPCGVEVNDFPTVDSTGINTSTQKVLVEEFTGHSCTGCPTSTADLLNQMEDANGEIIAVAIHAGNFSTVDPPKYPTDFTTDWGTEMDNYYPLLAYPSALVNRQNAENSTNKVAFLSFQAWRTPIDEAVGQEARVGLGVEANYDAENNAFAISVAGRALENLDGEYRLMLLCLEDSIIAPQKDARLNIDEYENQINKEYVHRHALRSHLNSSYGNFGEPVITNGISSNEWFGGQYCYKVPDNVLDPTHCTVVAFLLESSSELILQVEETHVKELE